ncbi:hypothetical protein A2U01_0112452 [Trifolium medium]|uniref:Uncharacterized protein n=1 Tax=Trifolium medium TaxID=97028 RepID=A0A392VRY1_9FABA|nr:hypothetical protein [Trifolium medium]
MVKVMKMVLEMKKEKMGEDEEK